MLKVTTQSDVFKHFLSMADILLMIYIRKDYSVFSTKNIQRIIQFQMLGALRTTSKSTLELTIHARSISSPITVTSA